MIKDLPLPPTTGGQHPALPLCSQSVVIVGANGSGKSRFKTALAQNLGNKAFNISALSALYSSEPNTPPAVTSINSMHAALGIASWGNNEFERLIALLLHDEMTSLLQYKLQRAAAAATAGGDSSTAAQLPTTRLDQLIDLWQQVYPDNRILVENENLKFLRTGNDNSYSVNRLSDGERAVLYIIGAMLYAPQGATVLVDNPEMFLHPTIMQSLWNRLEILRSDCTMIYTTHDLDFASSRHKVATIWVKNYDPTSLTWDYAILPPGSPLGDEAYIAIMGARRPVLFIEGDDLHSIDSRLYPLIFNDFTVKPLGSCNKVIEATRTFNDLRALHNMVSAGIVDRDRRDDGEIEYLNRKNIMVPSVAEIENILLLEGVIRAVATALGFNENNIVKRVKTNIIKLFESEYKQQALMHTRHRVKRTMEYRVDARFSSIDQLEQHINNLIDEIAPRKLYDKFCHKFKAYIQAGDYNNILRVYNRKSMLPGSNIAPMLHLNGRDAYLNTILQLLRENGPIARRIRLAVQQSLGIEKINLGNTTSKQ